MESSTTQGPPPAGVNPETGEITPPLGAVGEPKVEPVNPPAGAPTPPATEDEPKERKLTEFVVLYGLGEEPDDGKPPRNFALFGNETVDAANAQDAKRRVMANAPDAVKAKAAEGVLWLVAVPTRSFKNLKRVTPRRPDDSPFAV